MVALPFERRGGRPPWAGASSAPILGASRRPDKRAATSGAGPTPAALVPAIGYNSGGSSTVDAGDEETGHNEYASRGDDRRSLSDCRKREGGAGQRRGHTHTTVG